MQIIVSLHVCVVQPELVETELSCSGPEPDGIERGMKGKDKRGGGAHCSGEERLRSVGAPKTTTSGRYRDLGVLYASQVADVREGGAHARNSARIKNSTCCHKHVNKAPVWSQQRGRMAARTPRPSVSEHAGSHVAHAQVDAG